MLGASMRRSMPWCGAAGWLLCSQMGAVVVVSTAAAALEVKLNDVVNSMQPHSQEP